MRDGCFKIRRLGGGFIWHDIIGVVGMSENANRISHVRGRSVDRCC